MARSNFTLRDVEFMCQQATLPEKAYIQEVALNLSHDDRVTQVWKNMNMPFQFVKRGAMWNKAEEFASKIEIHYTGDESKPAKSLTRELLIALAGAYRRVLEPQHAKVQIIYPEEPVIISGGVHPRERRTIGLEELFQAELLGSIESVRFMGYIKTKDRGLCCSASFSFSAGQGSDASSEDKLARTGNSLERCAGPMPSTIKTLITILRPARVKDEYRKAPHRFPRVRKDKQLYDKAKQHCEELDKAISAVSRKDALHSFMKAAVNTTLDTDIRSYCKLHFRLDLESEIATEVISCLHASLKGHCFRVLSCIPRMLLDVLPFEEFQNWSDMIERCLKANGDGQGQASTTRTPASQEGRFSVPGGDEEVQFFKLKHANITDILRNLGFNLPQKSKYTQDAPLQWKDDSCLSQDQQTVKELASQMCLNGQSSVMHTSGVLVFVSPAVSRDIPAMVNQFREQGNHVSAGVMFISEHLQKLVWAVLNPGDFSPVVKGLFPLELPKNTAFPKEKKGEVLLLRGAPGGHFREQGLVSANATKAAKGPIDVDSHTESLESRPTRSTGDLPRQSTAHRPNLCDRPGRQPLKGVLRGSELRRHSEFLQVELVDEVENTEDQVEDWEDQWED